MRSAWKVPNMRSQMMSRPPWFLRPVGVASLCCIVVMGGQQMSMAGAEAGAGTEGGPPQQQRQLDRLQQCRGRRAVGSLAAVVAGVVDAVVAGGDEDVFNGPPQLANQLGVGERLRSRHRRRCGQSIISTATLRSASTAAARSVFIALPAPPHLVGQVGAAVGQEHLGRAEQGQRQEGKPAKLRRDRGWRGTGGQGGSKGLLAELDGRRRRRGWTAICQLCLALRSRSAVTALPSYPPACLAFLSTHPPLAHLPSPPPRGLTVFSAALARRAVVKL